MREAKIYLLLLPAPFYMHVKLIQIEIRFEYSALLSCHLPVWTCQPKSFLVWELTHQSGISIFLIAFFFFHLIPLSKKKVFLSFCCFISMLLKRQLICKTCSPWWCDSSTWTAEDGSTGFLKVHIMLGKLFRNFSIH